MGKLSVYLILVSVLLGLGECGCVREDWWKSFDKQGTSKCSYDKLLRGFYRYRRTSSDPISLLEEGECCDMASPWNGYAMQTLHADWWLSLDKVSSWAFCPTGYFLAGLYRSENFPGWLHNIEEGRCSKPRDHPNYYGHCYDQDISQCMGNENVCKCNDGYFVTGLYRGRCDVLYCLQTLRCCKMASSPETLKELSEVKTRIMDMTMVNMAYLAHYLGYGWCGGCSSTFVGEDISKHADVWRVNPGRECTGYKSDYRLSMAYGDWGFGIKDIRFGNVVSDDLIPETIDSGSIHNRDKTEASKTISRSETSVRTVTHTKTSGWKYAHELGVQITYLIASASYKFSYENSATTQDTTGKEYSKTFQISTSKTLAANSSASWRLVVTNSRKTIPYTATIIAKFSTELQGFLRWGGGYNGDSTNFHIHHRGSGRRPTFNYRFGDARTPFYAALKQQSNTNSDPWMWNDMNNKHRDVQNVINDLSNDNNYAFTLTGQFEVVEGKQVDLYWDGVPVHKRSTDNVYQDDEGNGVVKHLKQVARAGVNDVPAPRPTPPEMKIEVINNRIASLLMTAQGN